MAPKFPSVDHQIEFIQKHVALLLTLLLKHFDQEDFEVVE